MIVRLSARPGTLDSTMTEDLSPAERYAAARRRAAEQRTALAGFREMYDFGLDPFQIEACKALEAGKGVLVAAPTGSGKTIVGEFAVHLALRQGKKCFYTTPIKALSNQKYSDLCRRYGSGTVGLLTGDNSVNADAPVVVMTTEVLRNMLYAGSQTLLGLGYVVMDEVHYLSDRFRGAVWEEVIIHLPESVTLVSLSATVSNAEEFGDWLDTVRGDTEVIVSEHRPVPLFQHVLAGRRMYDLFEEGDGRRKVNPDLLRMARLEASRPSFPDRRRGRSMRAADRERERRQRSRVWTPSRPEVIERLDAEGLLPAITFIFSRAACEAAVQQCLYAGLRLNDEAAREEVRALVEERTASIPREDLHVLGYYEWLEGLERGIAAHHAGMLPTFKEVVEELFVRGLVKAVFATETLALGINMPARSVVLEKLVKWNGEQHADITPGEYTQLTGRAGRRGIDVEGHAVVLWQRGMNPEHLAGLAGTRTYPLRSSFKPSYNMAVNLVEQFGRHRSRELLESSFAQFQADKSVVGISRQVQRNEEGLAGYKKSMTCHLGDFEEYARLRRELKDRENELARQGAAQRRAEAAVALERLRPGDVIHVPTGKYAGLALVLDPGLPAGRVGGHRGMEYHDGPRPLVLTAERQVKRLASIDFPVPVEPVDRMRIPKSFNPRSPQSRRDLASALRTRAGHIPPERHRKRRSAAADDREIARLRSALRAHPCHGCDEREDHARWAERYHRLLRDTKQLQRRIEGRTNTIARTFDRIVALLTELDYLRGNEVTEHGRRLARLYGELDLLASECLRERVWEGLGPAELAACVSALVYESRAGDDAMAPKLPAGKAKEALGEMVRIWGRLDALEEEFRISQTEGVGQREPDLGFAWAAYMWASGKGLDEVLRETEMPAGDFVRWCKQVIDVLGQIAAAAPTENSTVARNARRAVDGLLRGVVAYSSVG
ncbi:MULTISPECIES: DEAD/DEAH box helicase [Streptomyces]|uniref:DEAD/DEAH box helicase n=1 Tax=Streptomyces thermoviolaceus subsp. thermoviolaceus TaxID=66860 RepID=A0ABX0YPF1_STRTL|nr:DEAD/DEAH box helicase [Streptomyces thermoviolaceus]MCM3264005.1 DEAD/DEAH box helicase [Streptomyces thermoviolaceus]NJP12900.1 DEAD/DEAH box helicase [Streptomyces thermoviolaceus subsp. thermoviolaceus]WTD51039.1 DEAD/DEAH box helicase [Streptomyces thermoviolaceus]GGV67859.1 helicase [Streptomyces thermoviolaceus subsp. apingens]GHA81728.1 helicase [Streptomyces thermoviolaceus subsp. thermoviolaceus]